MSPAAYREDVEFEPHASDFEILKYMVGVMRGKETGGPNSVIVRAKTKFPTGIRINP